MIMDKNELQVPIQETEHFWEDPQNIMNLIDLIFLFENPDRKVISS